MPMYIHVKVVAGAKVEKIEMVDKMHYKLWVKERAKGNSANRRVLEIIRQEVIKNELLMNESTLSSESLPKKSKAGIAKTLQSEKFHINVRIINGHHSPSKLLAIS